MKKIKNRIVDDFWLIIKYLNLDESMFALSWSSYYIIVIKYTLFEAAMIA